MSLPKDLSRSAMKQAVLDLVHGDLSEDIEKSCLELPEAFKRAHQRLKHREPTFTLPGFEKLTSHIGGLGRNGFTVITGPSGAGKSTIVGNLWVQLVGLGINCYGVPIEIGPADFVDMLFSIYSGKVRRKLTAADYDEGKVKWFPQFFSNGGNVLATHESRLSHIDFLAEVYYHYLTRGIGAAFADNWNFMLEPSGEIADNDRALHDCIVFAKKVPVHIFMIMHPKKPSGGSETDRVKSMYDVKGSSTSIQEAHNVWIFNRLENESDHDLLIPADFCREVLIAKARYNGRAVGSKVFYSIHEGSEQYKEYKIQ